MVSHQPIQPEVTTNFSVRNVGLSIDEKAILTDVSLDFPTGEVVALIGHNGSGKSSLLKILARQHAATSGVVCYAGRDVRQYHEREFARSVAYLPQDLTTGSDMTIRELVACGRYPWHGALGRFSELDRQKVDQAIEATHMADFADRMVGTLSGGERQRAWLGMLIAQDADSLLLDEPTAALDIAHQIEVLSLVRQLAHEGGRSVIVVLHDINMAARFCDRINALKGGRVVASGAPSDILKPEVLRTIYGIDMDVVSTSSLSHPLAYAC